MKKSIAILLLTSMLLQLCSKVGIITWFNINHKQIVELFCINKDKPQMACDGKCYLKSKLQKADNSETNIPSKQNVPIKYVNEELFITENKLNNLVLNTQKVYYATINNFYSHQVLFVKFNPPQV